MNTERIKILRDHIAALDASRFNMAYWRSRIGVWTRVETKQLVHDCNTCGCIGGWTEALFRKGRNDVSGADELLGIDEETADCLFYPAGNQGAGATFHTYDMVTQAHAVETLDKLLATGVVDWSHVK